MGGGILPYISGWVGQSVNQPVFNEHLLCAQPYARNVIGHTRNTGNLGRWEMFTVKLERENQ